MKRLFLLSSSPRRVELLKRFGYEFEVLRISHSERDTERGTPQLAVENARLKLDSHPKDRSGVYLACDTIVYLNGRIYGKPINLDEARNFLRELSGKTHYVYTGIAIAETPSGRHYTELVETEVKFKELDEDEIDLIVEYDNPLDKAGAYAIQGISGLFVERISGSYYNVVGLPVERLYLALKQFGITPARPWKSPRP